jgi:hypothetical protein
MTECVIEPITEQFSLAQNTKEKVMFRQQVLTVENGLKEMITSGEIEDALPDCTLTHHFSPVVKEYGCCTYAREMFIPQGTAIIGKIHKHEHLNFIMKGKVSVSTEFGKKEIQAPAVFVSEVGLKRAVYAEEDTIWVTVHITKHDKEENLAEIEEEVISKTYEEMSLISNMNNFKYIDSKGDLT